MCKVQAPRNQTGRFAITVEFEIAEGCAERFKTLVTRNAEVSVLNEPECLRFDVLFPQGSDGRRILLYEVYQDRAAFEAHLRSPHFLKFDAEAESMVLRKTVESFDPVENFQAEA